MVLLKIFAASDKMHAGLPTNIAENVHGFLGGLVTVHAKAFRTYMEDTLKCHPFELHRLRPI